MNSLSSDIDVYSVRIYNRGLTKEEIEVNSKADEKRFKEDDVIQIATEDELMRVENGKTYELKNDIEVNGDLTNIINKINNKEIEIKSNDKKIVNNGVYYMSSSRYTIPVNKYGYVVNGLEVHLDGIDNTGTGSHNNTASVWKDLSGKNRDGTLKNMDSSTAWEDDGLNFDGIDDIVAIDEMNYDNVTLEVVTAPEEKKNDDTYMTIIGNPESGGYHIIANSVNKFDFGAYISETSSYAYVSTTSQVKFENGRRYTISGTYDGSKLKRMTSNNYAELEQTGTIGTTKSNTYMVLGGNPVRSEYQEGAYHGTIYSARVYSRALSDEEKSVNYMADKDRYKVYIG